MLYEYLRPLGHIETDKFLVFTVRKNFRQSDSTRLRRVSRLRKECELNREILPAAVWLLHSRDSLGNALRAVRENGGLRDDGGPQGS